jgi:hypothetical protein
MMSRLARTALLLVVLLVGLGLAYAFLWNPPRLNEEVVRQTIYTSVQREVDASFYVTGALDISATTVVDNTRVLLPDVLGLSLGTSRATVRVPGRVSYGFEMREFHPEMIHVRGDMVEVQIPSLTIYSAEPDLSALEVETSVGWARLQASAQRAERTAIGALGDALRRQGEAHLESSNQPRVNTARAMETMLVPILEAAGFPLTRLRIHLGDGLMIESVLAET